MQWRDNILAEAETQHDMPSINETFLGTRVGVSRATLLAMKIMTWELLETSDWRQETIPTFLWGGYCWGKKSMESACQSIGLKSVIFKSQRCWTNYWEWVIAGLVVGLKTTTYVHILLLCHFNIVNKNKNLGSDLLHGNFL